MTLKNFNSEIDKLNSEIQLKNKEIAEYLDKIEYLEDLIMEIEADLIKKSDKTDASLLIIQSKELERKNRELKDRMGFLRLENIKLKQELEESKKGYFGSQSLINFVEDSSNSNEIEINTNKEAEINKDRIFKDELYKNIKLKCPICGTQKKLKIPTTIIKSFQGTTTINIPKGTFCEHSFQTLLDRYFTIKRYHVVNFQFNKVEFSRNIVIGTSEGDNEDLTNLPFPQEILNLIRRFVDDREILGIAIFDCESNLIFASVPSDSMVNIIKEFQVRKERQIRNITKMFIELKNHQKFFSKNIKILSLDFILVLLFSERINFGMGSMLFKEIEEKLVKINKS